MGGLCRMGGNWVGGLLGVTRWVNELGSAMAGVTGWVDCVGWVVTGWVDCVGWIVTG